LFFSSGSYSDVSIPYSSNYNNQTAQSLSLWFNTENNTTGDILSSFDSDFYKGYQMYLENGYLKFTMDNGTTILSTPINNNQWYHVGIAYNSSLISLYINGNKVGETSFSSSQYNVNTGTGLKLGNNTKGYFNGTISDVSIWNKALSQTEIQKLMISTPDTSDNNLVGYWPLNDGSGSSVKDYSSNSNNGSIYNGTWKNSAPTIYGSKIYSTVGIKVQGKFIPESFLSTPSISFTNSSSAPVTESNNTVSYTPTNTTTYNINFTATGTTYSNDLNISFLAYPVFTDINLTLNNVNLSEHNTTNIFFVNSDSTDNNVSIPNLSSSLVSGTTSFTQAISYSNYMIVFETDGQTSTQKYWYYNKSDGKLYSQADYNSISDKSNFIFSSSTNPSVTLSLLSSYWYSSSTNTGSDITSVTDTPIKLFLPMEQSITDYNSATPLTLVNNSSDGNISLYSIYETNSSSSPKPVTIDKTIISDSNAYKVAMNVSPSSDVITSATHTINDYNSTTNILSLKENNTTTATMFLKKVLTISELQGYYNNYKDLGFTPSFPSTAKGYELYKKQTVAQCSVDSASTIATRKVSNLSDLKSTYLYNAQATTFDAQNILVYNKYDSSKGLQLSNTDSNNNGILYEVQGTSSNQVGTWNEVSSNTDECNSTSIIQFHLNSGVNGYEHLAILKDKDGYYAQGVYIPTGDTSKEIFLNKEATQYLAGELNVESKLTLAYPLKTDWTYLSLPTNMTLCTSAYQTTLTLADICDQNFNIEGVFGTVSNDNNISVFKYRGGYWSNYTTDGKHYNMDRITSIDNTDGLLIHNIPNQKTIYLPYNIYNLAMDTYKVYSTGWHLVGTQFTRTPATFEAKTKDQGKTLKYIMKQNGYDDSNKSLTWEISSSGDDGSVDSSIDRIESIDPMAGFWIFVE